MAGKNLPSFFLLHCFANSATAELLALAKRIKERETRSRLDRIVHCTILFDGALPIAQIKSDCGCWAAVDDRVSRPV